MNIHNFEIENGILKKYKGDGGDVILPEGITEIGERAFHLCQTLTAITIPEGVTATLRLPSGYTETLTAGSYRFAE